MKRLLVVFALSLASFAMAGASLIPCTISGAGTGGAISSSTVVTCGGLTFDDFQVLNPTGGATGNVDIVSGPSGSQFDSQSGTSFLQFNPNLGANESEQILFQVVGGIDQIDMSVGGVNATVSERACKNPIATSGTMADLCTTPGGTSLTFPLGQVTVATGTPNQPVFSSPFNTTTPVYIFKNIQTGPGGSLTAFTQSFETGTGLIGTPEPLSMFLLGSGLLGLGLLRRRSRHN